jgi:O-antigen/teichoic acid export membrane protein
MSLLKQVSKSPAAQSVLTSGMIMVAGFGMSVLLARSLGAEGRGAVAAALLWPQLFIYLSSLGVQEGSLFYAASSKWNTGIVFTSAVIISLAQTFLFVPVAFVVLPFLLQSQTEVVVKSSQQLLIIVPFGLLTMNGFNILRGKLDFRPYYIGQGFVPILSLIVVSWFVIKGGISFERVITVYAVVYLLSFVLLLWVFLSKGYWKPFKVDRALSKKMITFGTKVQLGAISQLANLRLDQALMAALLPASQLGLYVVAVSAANIARTIPSAARTVLTPYVAAQEYAHIDRRALAEQLQKYWIINLITGLMLLIILPFVIPLVFGAEFRAAVLPAVILVLATICLGGKEILSGTTYGLGTPELVSQSEIVSLVFTFFALLLLLPLYGIVGAAFATLISYAAAVAFLAFQVQKRHGLRIQDIFNFRLQDVAALFRMIFNDYFFARGAAPKE